MIAVDVMGGDNAPGVVLEGALAAAKRSIPVGLYGPADMVNQWLDTHSAGWKILPIQVFDAGDVIDMDEEPVSAVRKKGQSSLVKAVASVAQGSSSAVISAGSSGALMVASTLIIGRVEGVERPAIAGFLPSKKGKVLALDLGANTECKPLYLHNFAQLAHFYLQQTFHINNPRVGLLSNGHEDVKGSVLVKETHTLLRNDKIINFTGNVEPYDIFSHKVDIVVCDGFTGNVLLKTVEGMADFMLGMMSPLDAQRAQNCFEHKIVGGALLLGIKGSVIVCHGGSTAHDIEHALAFAWSVSNPDN